MPWTFPLDPTTPADGSPIAQGDDRIREVKAALRERIATLVVDVDADPWVLKPELFPTPPQETYVGTLSSRPNPPTAANQVYIAEDTDQVFASKLVSGDPVWEEVKATQTEEPIIIAYSADESRFKTADTDSHAKRVKAAIAAAVLSTALVKIVFVPKSFFGYIADADFTLTMFDSAVLLIREGGMWGWYDPIAYGADPTGVANSQSVIDKCFLHASTTTIGLQGVAFTLPGTYLMSTNVDRRGCAMFTGAGVTFTGAGTFTGTVAFKIPAPDYVPPISDAAFVYNADAGVPRAAAATVVKRLYLRVNGTSNGSGQITISFGDSGFGGAYNVNNLVMCVASYRASNGAAVSPAPYTVNTGTNSILLDLDGGAQTETWDLLLGFSA